MVGSTNSLVATSPGPRLALMALRCLGYPDDHPEVQGQWRELEALEIEEGDTLRVQTPGGGGWGAG